MPVRPSPTVRSRRLRRELRRLREERGYTIEQAAAQAGDEWNKSTLGRWESGDRRIRPADLRHLLDVYGVTGEQRETLLQLAKEARQRGWWQTYDDVLPSEYSSYIGLETETRWMRSYQQLLIPGLLQTEDYAAAVIRAARPDDTAESINRRTAVRLDRQQVLTGDDPMKLWAVIDEAAIRRIVGDRAVMAAQLRHLADMGERPGIQLQVLPFTAGAHVAMAAAFDIMSFEPPDPSVVYIDATFSALFVERTTEVDAYRLMYEQLSASALSPGDSNRLFRTVAQELVSP